MIGIEVCEHDILTYFLCFGYRIYLYLTPLCNFLYLYVDYFLISYFTYIKLIVKQKISFEINIYGSLSKNEIYEGIRKNLLQKAKKKVTKCYYKYLFQPYFNHRLIKKFFSVLTSINNTYILDSSPSETFGYFHFFFLHLGVIDDLYSHGCYLRS